MSSARSGWMVGFAVALVYLTRSELMLQLIITFVHVVHTAHI